MSPQQQRPESPPFVTSEMHQSMEAYQQSFWQRQIARVEEQVSLPEDQMALIANARQQSIAAAAGGTNGSSSSSSSSAAGSEVGGGADQSVTEADIAASAKALMELFKPQAGQLPLARIKKVMKASDDEVKMISAEAPILFARACEIFIADLTCRSYMHATANRRRTVQRSDVVAAVAGSNLFDFLVDIVPRAEAGAGDVGGVAGGATGPSSSVPNETEEGVPIADEPEPGTECINE